MTNVNVTATVRKPTAAVSVIDIGGEVNGFAENALMDAYAQASDEGTEAIIFNFEELDYLNSSGIGLLVTLLIRAQRQGQKLMACGLTDHYQEIFQLTKLDEAISIHKDDEAALGAVA